MSLLYSYSPGPPTDDRWLLCPFLQHLLPPSPPHLLESTRQLPLQREQISRILSQKFSVYKSLGKSVKMHIPRPNLKHSYSEGLTYGLGICILKVCQEMLLQVVQGSVLQCGPDSCSQWLIQVEGGKTNRGETSTTILASCPRPLGLVI